MDITSSARQENEQRVAEEYLSSLSDLNCNSKPLINMLTMLAEENIEYAAVIVNVVEEHIAKVPPDFKLPILYLIDSIVKNVKSTYVQLFGQCIVNIFCGAFERVNEKIRERMYALRQTWNEVFSAQKLYALDVKVKCLDHNWPITAKQPSIHVNPNFLKANVAQAIPTEKQKILQDKTRALLELKKLKLELELEATKKDLEEQEKQISKTTDTVIPPVEALIAANVGGMQAPTMINMPTGYMRGPTNLSVNTTAIRPNVFHPNMGGFRPHLQPNMINMPVQANMIPGGGMAGATTANANNKPRVHPVNSALLNSVKQRDPRLQRQQQQQQMEQHQNGDRSLHNKQQNNVRFSHNEKDKHNNNNNNNKSGHKSPARLSSNNNGRSAGSNRGKNSQRNKDRDRERERERERDRKRSESKSSSTSTSSSGSATTNNERKKLAAKSSDKKSAKCDKDAFEIAPLSTAFKRKSSSPLSSPCKLRDAKRPNSHRSSSKTRSRSRSPPDDNNKVSTPTTAFGDIDLRRNSTSSTSSSMINSPDKRTKLATTDTVIISSVLNNDQEEDVTKLPSATDKVLDKTTPVAEPVTGCLMDIDLRPQFNVATCKDSTASPAISTQEQVFDSSLSFSSLSSSSSSNISNNKTLDFKSKFMPASVNMASPTTKMNFIIPLDEDIFRNTATASAKNVATTTSSPKVSFKIHKIFNKLEKSTENILSSPISSSVSTTTTTAADAATSSGVSTLINSNRLSLETLQDTESPKKEENNHQIVSKDNEEDVKKRPMAPANDEEPLAKKSKSAKIDALFGSEDVDLRQLIPPTLSAQTLSDDDIPPPPPSIKLSNDTSRDTNENWDNLKTEGNNKNLTPKTTKSSLDDVRAKLAKTAKLSKLSKLDKLTRDIDHRNKLLELQMNDDTQEANDEKIRTMITQAQELLETNSISQEQHKHLIKTVMSINETNKLKEAKRRESLNAIKQKLTANIEAEASIDATERNLAMQAVLKKRIPKLNKLQNASVNEHNPNANTQPSDDKQQDDIGGDRQDSNEEPAAATSSSRAIRGAREKRGPKVSKWGERVVEPPTATSNVASQQRPWNSLMPTNKRGGGMPTFRGNVPQNIRPTWQMGVAGGGGGGGDVVGNLNSINGAPLGPYNFGNSHMGNMRANNNMPQITVPLAPTHTPVIPKPCNSIDNPQEDLVRTITIDGAAKEIRFYDQVAIVFMELDQPREIGFQNGQRNIFIDNSEPVILHFNDGYKTVQVDGETLNLRFGFPSRELYIDEHWYEIYFGGPPISVPIRNQIHMLKAEGPPPQVNIGPLRRDLVVGKINMIVDAHNVIPLFLDARMQTFKLADTEHTIQFADNLYTVLLNGTPTRVEYGGLPKSLFLAGKKYFVRFGALPQGVIAGKVQIKDMLYIDMKPPNKEESKKESLVETLTNAAATATAAGINAVELQKTAATVSVPILPAASLSNINIDELFQKLLSTGILGGSSGILPAVNNAAANSSMPTPGGVTITESNKPVTAEAASTAEEVLPPPPSVHLEPIKPVDLTKPESIKIRQAAIVETLFSGMQCSSCGVRFPPEQTIKYSQHLDWHFRQNRRERDSSRKAHARKWYYDLNDWMQYEEIEDLEEREKIFLDAQQNDADTMDEASNQRSTNSPLPTCPAGADDVNRACDMCQEKFEQFYDNELEEWHLRCAIRIEGKIYHPLCYEDYKASLNPPAQTTAEEEETPAIDNTEISLIQIEDDNAVDNVIKVEENKNDKKIETTETLTVDDDDDDVIVLPNEEPSVTEIVDDDDEDEYVPANVTREHMGNVREAEGEQSEHNETNESDVEIQEPNIPFTDLDTYVEKERPEGADGDQMSFMNVKIKVEPKEDDDEDDGFEEVGTVVPAPDEISLNSSEDTQTIELSHTALMPLTERPPSATSPTVNHIEDLDSQLEPPATELNNSMDGNIETGDEHNLSAAGLVPTVPLASLVNKIKINITKNTVTTSSNTSTSSSSATALSTKSSSNSLNQTDSLGHGGGGGGATAANTVANPIPTISTIPVLCGGGTTISSIVGGGGGSGVGGGDYDEYSAVNELGENSVSTISVIGSYGSAVPTITHLNRPVAAAAASVVSIQPPKPATPPLPPPPAEETITYELKPVLQKASLKKKEKVICGNETSGLCSIM